MSGRVVANWMRVGSYGAALALGTAALQWLDYQRMARIDNGELYLALVGGLFLVTGIAVGLRLASPRAPEFDGNPAVQAALGISARELEVLQALAGGLSNKEIARQLEVSPNTVKTHVAHLFEKLAASRRTDAIARARELGLLP